MRDHTSQWYGVYTKDLGVFSDSTSVSKGFSGSVNGSDNGSPETGIDLGPAVSPVAPKHDGSDHSGNPETWWDEESIRMVYSLVVTNLTNPRVKVVFSNPLGATQTTDPSARVIAYTKYSESEDIDWSDSETGSSTVNAEDGDKYIATSTLVAPNNDTTWSVSSTNPCVDTWMGGGNRLYARVKDTLPPGQPTVSVAPEGWTNSDSFTFTWNDPGDNCSGVKGFLYKINAGEEIWTTVPSVSGAFAYQQGENKFYVRAKDYLENVGEYGEVTFYFDNQAPTTTVSVSPQPGSGGWYCSDVTVTLSADDGSGSGVKETKYKIGSGSWQTYSAQITVSAEGTTNVYYYSVDECGNQEVEKSKEVKIDKTKPTKPDVIDDGPYTTSKTELHATWTSEDAESGIAEYQYAIGTSEGGTDEVGWTSTGTTAEVTKTGLNLESGQTYYFTVKARNGAGCDWSEEGYSAGIKVGCTKCDVSLDGFCLINDAVLLLNHIVDPIGNPFNAEQKCAGDMDGNDVILINDAVLLLKMIAEGAPSIDFNHYSEAEAKILMLEFKTRGSNIVRLIASPVIAGISISLKYQNARLLDIKAPDVSAIHRDGDAIQIAWLNFNGDDQIVEIEFEGNPVLNAEDITVSDPFGNLISTKTFLVRKIVKNLLLQNYPNPFNPETWVPYQLAEDADVTICIYDQTGHLIRRMGLGKKQPGIYITKGESAYWDGRNENGEIVAAGVYFYTIKTGNFSATRKMIMLK